MPCASASIFSAEEESLNLTDLTDVSLRNASAGNYNSAHSVKVLLLFLLLPIVVFATLGNLLIIASVAYFRQLQTCTNAFIVSLATADFLVGALVMPFSLVRSVDRWRFGERFCTAHFLLDVVLCTASILNLSCVALDRYLAVCDPLRYAARMSPKRVAKLLLASWFLPVLGSCLLVAADLSRRGKERVLRGSRPDDCFPELRAPYAALASILSFFLPMAFMVAAYGRIYLEAQKQARQIQAEEARVGQNHQTQGPSGSRKEGKATRTLGVLLSGFLVCWLPFFSVNVGHPSWACPVSRKTLECVLWLGYANSALNPVLCAFVNRAFRRAFVVLLGCGMLGHRPQGSRLNTGVSWQTSPEVWTATR